VGEAFRVARSHRGHRLRAFRGLNLDLLIHALNHCVVRRIQAQPCKIPYFLCKKWIVRQFEVALPIRFQSKGLRDAVHRRFRQVRLRSDLSEAQMRAAFLFGLQGLAHQLHFTLTADRARAHRA
jgi:hypothetical protein